MEPTEVRENKPRNQTNYDEALVLVLPAYVQELLIIFTCICVRTLDDIYLLILPAYVEKLLVIFIAEL